MKPAVRTTTAAQRRNQVEAGRLLAQQEAAEREARLKKLYGALLADVEFLRRCGFVVNAEARGRYVVGNKTVDGETLKAMADRERRLRGEAGSPGRTVSGLKIGDRVAIAPKTAPARATPLSSEKTGLGTARKVTGAAATARAANVPSADLGPRPDMKWLKVTTLGVDARYQRDVGGAGEKHINRIMREFNWSRCQPLVVAEDPTVAPGDRYIVIDGQHRLNAARKHGGIVELPCYIVAAPDVAAQASIFSSINSRRLGLTSQQKFFSAVAAGEDEAVRIQKLCERTGVTILRSPPSSDIPPRSVLAPATLMKLLRQLGPAPLGLALALLAETHPETINGFRSPTIAALARIAADKTFSRNAAARVLKGLDLDKFYVAARNERTNAGGTIEAAAERVLRRKLAGGGKRK